MTTEDLKKVVLMGIIGGISAGITIVVSVYVYLAAEKWYKDYKEKQTTEILEKQGKSGKWTAVPCIRGGLEKYSKLRQDTLVERKNQYYLAKLNDLPFNEITLDKDTPYYIDIDFDGEIEKIFKGERGDIFVFKKDKSGDYTVDISSEKPFCWIRINSCCPAHKAYTTINYAQRTIYSEAHYGCDYIQKKFQKVGNIWVERLPIRPLSIISKELFPETHQYKIWLCGDRSI